VAVPGLVRLAREPVLDRHLGAGNAALHEASDDPGVLKARRVVVPLFSALLIAAFSWRFVRAWFPVACGSRSSDT